MRTVFVCTARSAADRRDLRCHGSQRNFRFYRKDIPPPPSGLYEINEIVRYNISRPLASIHRVLFVAIFGKHANLIIYRTREDRPVYWLKN